ncbi:AAA domain-containing protein [Luteimonas salinisoli]|nr:AAA domain-containing protein [Luteimonas salinisoli]
MRWCPGCESERPLEEQFCCGPVSGGGACGWVLSGEPIHPRGWRPATVVTGDGKAPALEPAAAPSGVRCRNGHAIEPDDLICMLCGAEPASGDPADSGVAATGSAPPAAAGAETVIEGWRLLARIAETAGVRERYRAVHDDSGREAVLTLYCAGAEPDPDVYEAVGRLSRDYVPELLATGRWDDRAFEAMEALPGGTLADLGIHSRDIASIRHVLRELGSALHAFAEVGLRHRDLRPEAILVREREPLDLVIGGFGSAQLSAFDLDLVAPLETSRYMAPEAVAGGVAAASDWWSLGMLLLEQATGGACFGDVHPNAWLIHVLAHGVPLPEELPPELALLFRGLLAYDHHQRWQWREVEAWLAGASPPAPPARRQASDDDRGEGIALGGRTYRSTRPYALAAGEAQHWDEAAEQLRRGRLATWAERVGLDAQALAALRHLARHEALDDDFRLMLALVWLNPEMPLIHRGRILSPGWLLERPEEGWRLVASDAPDLLAHRQPEHWLPRMKARLAGLRERAKHRGIALDEAQFRILALSTSRARLAAHWQARQSLLPDSPHAGIQSLAERAMLGEEDLIVLLAADIGQFQSADSLLDDAARTARRIGIDGFGRDAAAAWLQQGRRAIWQEVEGRLQGFASCGIAEVDGWAGRYRVQRRLPIADALVLLAVPVDRWVEPRKQQYVSELLDFFGKKVANAALRGPLVRMGIARNSSRIDLVELDSPRRPAAALLDALLQRGGQSLVVDPAALDATPLLRHRLHVLERNRSLYERDTGIDGLYLGFPFLLVRDPRGHVRTRIAPVLLWPVGLELPVGRRSQARVGFDSGREEVRLNPAFEGLLGSEERARWLKVAEDLLRRSALTAADVMDAFGMLAQARTRTLAALPPPSVELEPGQQALACAAVLFHAAFMGQAVGEELRQLQQRPPGGTGLETLLRLREGGTAAADGRAPEAQRFLTAQSDPSQEAAVAEAARSPGLAIEGPPGTGKSQTIVNIVADAIGNGRTLLLICQKHAALEVVHKRLIAEGLGERVVMLNDVNRDREPTIRAIREQVEALLREPPPTDVAGRRERLAARIEALEGELDHHHRSQYRVDEDCGLAWRQLLAELMELEADSPPPDFPALRPHLAGLDIAALARLEESCAPLVRWWLPARYEGSPLAQLRAFETDEASRAAFAQAFGGFAAAEAERERVLAANPSSFEIEDPAPHRAWLAEHAATLRALQEGQRQRLARWLPLFRGNAVGDQLIARLEALGEALDAADGSAWHVRLSPALSALPAARLADLHRQAQRILAPATRLARLNPLRWFGRARVGRFLREQGETGDRDAVVGLAAAAGLETAWRPSRAALTVVHQQLMVPPPAPDSGPGLAMQGAETLRHLREARETAVRLSRAPDPSRADTAAGGGREALDRWLEEVQAALQRHAARQASLERLGELAPWLQDAPASQFRDSILGNAGTASLRGPIHDALPDLVAYQQFRTRAAQLREDELALLAHLRPMQETLDRIDPERLERTFRRLLNREARLAWKQAIERKHPQLLLEAGEHDARISRLAEAEAEMRDLNRRHLASRVDPAEIGTRRQWEDITRLRGARTRRLREFLVEGIAIGLMRLKPVWLMNPDVASRVLPLEPGLFDTVIYDEASQMPVEYALPTLYRGRVAVVSGDEKQMPPTAFFSSRLDDGEGDADEDEVADDLDEQAQREAREEEWNRREIKDCPDLLQLARGSLPGKTLQIHYRSGYRELIGYSNAAFYRNRLNVPVRHPDATVLATQPLEWRQIDGVYRQQTNAEEAQAVVEWLAALWRRPAADRPSVGVVTFNRKQADLIEDLMEERAEVDEDFRRVWDEERNRQQDGEDMAVFVKNVENVQGDERDVIVFSTTFGRDPRGVFRRNFGVLGQHGGERRLNVAVTRARKKMLVMSSMPVADVADFLVTRRPPGTPRDYLQGWLAYARMLSSGDFPGARALLSRLHPAEVGAVEGGTGPGDGFSRSVGAFIRSLGHAPVAVGGDDAFALDFAIEDPASGLYAIGIECGGPRHPLLAHARAREIWRPKVLGKAIPHLHRVPVLHWYRDPDGARADLAAAIANALRGVSS